MPFDRNNSKIAITLPEFTLLKSADSFLERYSEPYIISFAIDKSEKASPEINFNFMPFPKVRKNTTVTMLGDGHLIYGPKNPGDFIAMSVIMMESDADMRERGEFIKKITKSKAANLGIKAVVAANPGSAAVVAMLKELTLFVASELAMNGDDELFKTEGAFLRDLPNPYHIDRSYKHRNDYVEVSIKIIALDEANGKGAATEKIEL